MSDDTPSGFSSGFEVYLHEIRNSLSYANVWRFVIVVLLGLILWRVW